MFYLWDLAAIEMQIRSANRGGGNTQNDIVRLLNAGIGTFQPYVMWTVIRQCFHAASGVTVNVAFDYKRVAIPERLPEKQAALGFFLENTRLF
ncbi:hypothetical protein SEEC0006_00255 [Salmonella enterica subsp. enterica serovar Choleraesuis str. 0006]|nr:hypothetical protein SEEC0006_00255 [Salmonella enterica subsp. enterica serovar Choleraesuis str. 0006]